MYHIGQGPLKRRAGYAFIYPSNQVDASPSLLLDGVVDWQWRPAFAETLAMTCKPSDESSDGTGMRYSHHSEVFPCRYLPRPENMSVVILCRPGSLRLTLPIYTTQTRGGLGNGRPYFASCQVFR